MPRYHCRTCGTSNPDLYITCNHPACPDGRDQGVRPHQMAHNAADAGRIVYRTNPWAMLVVAGVTAFVMAGGFWMFLR